MHAMDRPPGQPLFEHYDLRRSISTLQEGNKLQMMQETLFTEPEQGFKLSEKQRFFNWQCVSLVRENGTTLDLLIYDSSDLMVLINVVQAAIFKPVDQRRLDFFKMLKIKMKLGYISWHEHTKPKYIF